MEYLHLIKFLNTMDMSGRSLAVNVSAMSSGGFGTTQLSNYTNEYRKHKR